MPKQSLLNLRLVFGLRQHSATLAILAGFLVFQLTGVAIFSSKAQADSPFRVEIEHTTPGLDRSIAVSGEYYGQLGVDIDIKLDGVVVGTIPSINSHQWSYTISGPVDLGQRTVTAEVRGDALQTAEHQIALQDSATEIFYAAYQGWEEGGNTTTQRFFGPSGQSVEDTVHHKAYHINDLEGFPSISIQDTITRDYLAKVTQLRDDPRKFPRKLLLGLTNEYVYVISDDDGYGTYISRLSTLTNRIVSTVAISGNESEEGTCTNGAGTDAALSPDGGTLFIRGCEADIDKYNTVTGAFVGQITSAFGEADRGRLQVSPDGTKLYSYSWDENLVYAYNATTGAALDSFTDSTICTGGSDRGPADIALSPDGNKLYVKCAVQSFSSTANRVYGIDLDDWTAILSPSDGPIVTDNQGLTNMVFNSDGSVLYVGRGRYSSDSTIRAINTSTQDVTVSPSVSGYLYNNDQDIITYSKEHNQVLVPQLAGTVDRGKVWDIAGNTVSDNTLDVPNDLPMSGIHVGAALGKKYTTDGYHNMQISDLHEQDFSELQEVEVGNNPRGVVADSTDTYAYVANMGDGTITKISVADAEVVATIPTHSFPYAVTLSPDNSTLYVTHYHTGEVSVISTSTNSLIDTIEVGDNPVGLDISPDGTKLFVANSGDDTVSVIATNSATVTGTINVGVRPLFVRVNHAGNKVYVANNGSGSNNTSVSSITIQDNSVDAWSDSSYGSYGVNNIDVSADDDTVYVTTQDVCSEERDSVYMVALQASDGAITTDATEPTSNDCTYGGGYTYVNTTPYHGFGKAMSEYLASDSMNVVVEADSTNVSIVTITSPANATTFASADNDVTITGTGPKNKTVTVYMDGNQVGTTSVNSQGVWSYVANNVATGSHNFDAKWIPSKDVAFIPYVDSTLTATRVRVVDTSDNSIIKTFTLPQGSVGISSVINHAGTKVYVSGYSSNVLHPTIWEIDVATGLLGQQYTAAGTIHLFGPLAITADDQYGYTSDMAASGSRNVAINKFDLSNLSPVGSPVALNTSNFTGSPLFYMPFSSALAISGNSLYSPVSITNDADPETASIVNLLNNTVSSLMIIGEPRTSNYAPLVIGAGDRIYFATNKKLVEVNPQNNTVTKEITVTSASNYMALAFAVDTQNQKAYMVTQSTIYIVDLATEALIDTVAIDQPTSYVSSVQLSSDLTLLHIVQAGKVKAFNVMTKEFITPSSDIVPAAAMVFSLGDFVGQITPPSATVSFSVAAGPVVDPPPEDPDPDPPVTPEDPDPPTVAPDPDPDPPTVTDVTPEARKTFSETTKKYFAPLLVAAPENSLLGLVKRLPEPFALGFPWLLLILALILVAIQYYQVHSESLATKRVQVSVANQERLVDEQNNFVALSTHYLHTPLTVMEGEITLMVKAGTLTQEQANKLKATLSSLSIEAEAVLAQEEQHESGS